jgi:hypothetical protein
MAKKKASRKAKSAANQRSRGPHQGTLAGGGQLPGSIEPADYKRYALPIIFLRFFSLRYERQGPLRRLASDGGRIAVSTVVAITWKP